MKKIISAIINNDKLYNLVPDSLKKLGRSILPSYKFDQDIFKKSNRFVGTKYEWENNAGSEYTLGILYDFSHFHHYFMEACIEENVSYKVINITKNNWIEELEKSGCTTFLVWPSVQNHVWKNLFDNRLRFMVEELKLNIYPNEKELWVHESKLRVLDWLKTKTYPAPKSWIFYNENEALDFISTCTLPIVFKSDIGAGSKGVMIIRDRSELSQLIKTCFNNGFIPQRGDQRDRQWGYIIFQEYLENVEEWRMVRIGDSFLCRKKERVGDYHSGTGKIDYAEAPQQLLNLTKDLTEKEKFTSMCIDVFETQDGRYLINELHPVFGAKQLAENKLMGRYKFLNNDWVFEKGPYYDNACCNLRVRYVIDHIISSKI